jgi:hypothetical protein
LKFTSTPRISEGCTHHMKRDGKYDAFKGTG